MDETILSVRAYGRHRGVSHTAIQRAIQQGRLKKSLRTVAAARGPQVALEVADLEWSENTHPGNARSPLEIVAAPPLAAVPVSPAMLAAAAPPPDSYRQSMTQEKPVKVRLAQMQLETREGRLVEISAVRTTFFEIVRALRNELLEIPDRLCDELAMETDPSRVRAMLMREFKDCLSKLARRSERANVPDVGNLVAGVIA